MSDNRYNGWTNYEMWVASFWLTNDEGRYNWLVENAEECVKNADGDKDDAAQELATRIESFHDEFYPEVSGLFADLLRSAFDAIDWREIADNAVADVEYEVEVEDE
jgi:hypothetical protein